MDTSDLFEAIENIVDETGVLLVDMSIKNIGRSHMIRLLVDRPERINISECASLSREIRDYIDGKMLLTNYRLEVSSPGIGRLLGTEVDWIRSVGRYLSIEMENDTFIDWLEEYSDGSLKFREGRIVTPDEIVKAVEVLD
ncbi:MAG: hypothetical protein ABFR50_10660 [Candidatus Fermentibacteria bacterium]